MAGVRKPRAVRDELFDDEAVDSIDVPAAVVCTQCGRGDCSGCSEENTGASGVIAIVPWERASAPWGTRFFATVQATTRGAESFFCALPDGAVSPAFRFAVIAETFAVASTALVIAPLTVLGIPGLLLRFLTSGSTRVIVGLSTTVGILGFTLLLVSAHALHGLALGGAASRSRALRLGLYACGWDFGSSPAGVVAGAFSGGPRAAFALIGSSVTAPSRAVDAALSGIFERDGDEARKAKRRAMRLAMIFSVPAVVVVLALICATALFV
ncbi:MAG TPA: hypothetical protein VJT73_16860 [Polyangiaceae bacterium]|nr:hypothetical protein [Polyangiaceae bacterium]